MIKLLFTSLLLLTPVSLFAGPCYLLIEEPGTYKLSTISDFARTVISQYIRPIDPDPLAGISDKSCKYLLTVDETTSSITVTISVENTDNSGDNIYGIGDSNNRGFPGFKEAILRAIFRAKPAIKSDICTAYSTMITYDCGQKSSSTIVAPTTLPPPPKVLSSPLFGQSEKPQTIIVPTGSFGEISEVRKKMLEKTLESKLDDYFAIVPKDLFEEAKEQAFQEMESDECTEEQCIMMIREILQVENSFQMVLMVGEENTQISLTWNDLDQKRVEEDYCEGCKTKQLRQSIEGLVDKMFDTYKVKVVNQRNKETTNQFDGSYLITVHRDDQNYKKQGEAIVVVENNLMKIENTEKASLPTGDKNYWKTLNGKIDAHGKISGTITLDIFYGTFGSWIKTDQSELFYLEGNIKSMEIKSKIRNINVLFKLKKIY